MTATVHDIAFGATILKQVSNVSHSDGGNVVPGYASGEADAAELYGGTAEEVTTITSGDLETLVDLNTSTFASAGLCITDPATLEVPFKSRADCGVFASGTSHDAIAGNEALIIPTQFSASQDDAEGATAQVEIHWKSDDGITPGIADSNGNSISAAAFNAMFGLGKAYVNSVEIADVQSFTVNCGLTIVAERTNGGVYPIRVYITKREPTIEIVTTNLAAALTRIGYVDPGGNVDVYFRKKLDGGVYVSDVSTEHIRFRFAEGLQRNNALSVSATGDGTGTITVRGKALVGASGVAIP